jgi:hypothetical protein
MNDNAHDKVGKNGGGLNGLRIPLLIDGVMFLSVVIGGTLIWSDVQQLKQERQQRVSGERIATLEAQVDALAREVRRNDEEGQRDRMRIWQQLERDRNGRR